MELVVAGQHTQVLALLEVFCADGAPEVLVVGRVIVSRGRTCHYWLCRRNALMMFFSRRYRRIWHCLCRLRGGCVRRARHCVLCLRPRHLIPICISCLRGGGQFDIGWLGRLFLAKLDNGNRVQDGATQPPRPALPRSSQHVAGPIAFGVAVRAHGAGDDDNEEQRRDDARDAVQDDHGHSRRRRGAQRILRGARTPIAAVAAVAVVAPALHADGERGGRGGRQERGGRLLVGHGEHGEVPQRLLVAGLLIVAVVGGGAVQDGARDVGLVIGVLEDLLGAGQARVVGGVAADVGDVADGNAGRVGVVCVVEAALDLSRTQTISLGNHSGVARA
jgi:hypothetical protein